MIRIDEIYNNVFLPVVQNIPNKSLHWFDPFGSTSYQDICAFPKTVNGQRYLFWDQEPLHKDRVKHFFDHSPVFFRHDSDVTVITSEYNSKDVAWLCDTYGFKNDYYFFHAWAALDWYRGYNRSSLAQNFAERRHSGSSILMLLILAHGIFIGLYYNIVRSACLARRACLVA